MRKKKHPEYYAIPAFQKLSKLSDEEVAQELGICVRTYKDKIKGYSDFSNAQGNVLTRLFKKSRDEIFLI